MTDDPKPRAFFTTWKPLIVIFGGLCILSLAMTLIGLSWQPEPRRDDLERLVARFGRPDYDSNTADDSPRPFIVTRILTYERARVRAVYRSDRGAWVLIGYLDSATDSKISGELALTRLEKGGHE